MFRFEDILSFRRLLAIFPEDVGKFEAVMKGVETFAYNERGLWERFSCPKFPRDVLICGGSDCPLTEALYQKSKDKALYWFSMNKQTSSVRGIPIGIADTMPIELLWKHMNAERGYRNLVYMAFSIQSYPPERQLVWDKFKDKEWVTAETVVPQDHFFEQMRHHKFVLCPRGYGVETFRMWESIYLGAIPIVKRDTTHEDWEDLPVVWIDDWDEVTPEFLESVDMSNRSAEKAKMTYWVDQITQEKSSRRKQSA